MRTYLRIQADSVMVMVKINSPRNGQVGDGVSVEQLALMLKECSPALNKTQSLRLAANSSCRRFF